MHTQSYGEAIRWLTLAADQFERLHDRPGLAGTLDRLAYALIQQGSYAEAAKQFYDYRAAGVRLASDIENTRRTYNG